MWATPNPPSGGQTFTEGSMSETGKTSTGEKRSVHLSEQVGMICLTGPQVQPPATNGSESLPSVPTSRRRLNPRFVEKLQGCPEGWVQLEPMNSEVWETWLSQSKALLRS